MDNVIVMRATMSGMTPSTIDVSDYLTHLRSWGASPATVKVHRVVANALVWRYGPPQGITTDMITEWLASPDFSPKTRAAYCSHARGWFRWLVESGRLDRDPMTKVRNPRQPKGRPRPLTPREVAVVMDSAHGHLRTWLLLGMLAGLRAHEVAKVRGEDVTETSLTVLGKGGKVAILPTHPDLWALAQTYPARGFWFPARRSDHIHSNTVTKGATDLFLSLDIAGSHHRMRHTFGTSLLRGGANIRVVQELLRHESLATTAIYTAVDDDERTAAINLLAA